MTNDTTIARLAAANPLPDGAELADDAAARVFMQVLAARPEGRPPRRRLLAVAAAAAAITVPAAAFAGAIGGFLGLSNPGTPVATTDVVGADGALAQAMAQLRFPEQVADLGERAGFHFYVTANAADDLCFAISAAGAADTRHPKVVGCVPRGSFPGTGRALLDFSTGLPDGGRLGPSPASPFAGGKPLSRLLGFAADGVATVVLLDAEGDTIASTPVVGNVYADTDVPPQPATAIVALDAAGAELDRIG